MSTAQFKHKHRFQSVNINSLYGLGWVYSESTKVKQVAIASTCQVLSHELLQASLQSLIEANVKIVFLGELPLDFAIAASIRHKVQSLFYFGNYNSNNPSEFNLDIFDCLTEGKIDYTSLIASKKEYLDHDVPLDSYQKYNYATDYSDYLIKHFGKLTKRTKVAIDCGNSFVGKYIVDGLKKVENLTVVPLHTEADKDYPHHFPDPGFRINTAELRELVAAERCDFGVSLNNSGSTIRVIDSSGREVENVSLNQLIMGELLAQNPGRKIVVSPEYQRVFEASYPGKIEVAKTHEVMDVAIEKAAIMGATSTGEYHFGVSHYAPSAFAAVLIVAKLCHNDTLINQVGKINAGYQALPKVLLKLSPTSNVVQLVSTLKESFGEEACDCIGGLDLNSGDARAFVSLSNHDYQGLVTLAVEAASAEKAIAMRQKIIEAASDIVTEIVEEELIMPGEIWELTPRQRVELLLQNIYYGWNRHSHSPTHPLYNDNWIDNPTAYKIIREMSEEEFGKFWDRNRDWVHLQLRHLDVYLAQETYYQKLTKTHKELDRLINRPIAYFSLEYGLADWLQIYSGGLGVLAGDTLKQASDTGLPLVGVGVFYSFGYFHQQMNDDGWQEEVYKEQKITDYPFNPALTPDGEIAEIAINILDHLVYVRAFTLQVGRTKLVLLDTNYDKNALEEDRLISGHLYGGDKDTRIRQEILLGIGGYQMLLKMGVEPSICHMNEGHSAFVAISIIERLMRELQINFATAKARAKDSLVFTNHTLKPAGNDTFNFDLSKKYLEVYANKLSVPFEDIYRLGFDELNPGGEFSMTLAAMNSSKLANAVSRIHSRAAEKLWPNHKLIPITNGVHMPTWVARPIHQLLDQYATEDWHEPYSIKEFSSVAAIPKSSLWRVHQELKQALIDQLNAHLGLELDAKVLTLSWFRRFAAYKRPDMIISDINRLKELANSEQKIQILIGGKAHPRDQQGKELMQRVYRELQAPEFKNKFVFIPGYNWRIAKMLVAGSDVWINTPQRYEEACGTSGMKAAANGLLQLTTLDGWTDEVDWTDMGWVLPDHNPENFFNTIAQKVIPLYYTRDEQDLPLQWTEWMLRTIEMAISRFSSERQVNDYLRDLYLPIAKEL